MDEGQIAAEGDAALRRRADCLDVLIQRFGIDSALIGVPKLARVLGMGSSTLYSYMRAGSFFLPYRMVNGTPMVKIDDLVGWYLDAEGEIPANAKPRRPAAGVASGGFEEGPVDPANLLPRARRGRPRASEHSSRAARGVAYEPSDIESQEDADRAVDGIVASVLARMERQPSSRSRPRSR